MSTKGNISVTGAIAFCDLFTPGGAPGFPPKFSLTLQVAKGSHFEKIIFEEVQNVAQRTWPNEWQAKLADIHGDILRGVSPKQSRISLQDGDQIQRDYNAGFWVLKPSRRANQGPPLVFSLDGKPVHSAGDAGCPQPGWGVTALLNVWAMKTQDRVNFTILAVRAAVAGVKEGGPSLAQLEAEVGAFLAEPVPQLVVGVVPAHTALPAGPTGTAGPPTQRSAVPGLNPAPRNAVPQGPPAQDLGIDEGSILRL